jgi:hypothetical protein
MLDTLFTLNPTMELGILTVELGILRIEVGILDPESRGITTF